MRTEEAILPAFSSEGSVLKATSAEKLSIPLVELILRIFLVCRVKVIHCLAKVIKITLDIVQYITAQ